MKTECDSRQLQLYPGDQVPWENLPVECQRSVIELLSLLLEQSVNRQVQPAPSTHREEYHV